MRVETLAGSRYELSTPARNQPIVPIILKPYQLSVNQASISQGKKNMSFTSLPMSYVELYYQLFEANLVRPYFITPLQPPYPTWYDSKAQCEYHVGILGQHINNCLAFKKLVQSLIKTRILKVDSSNVEINPLPNHDKQ
ncbi:hypothetical protein GQ457_05G025850 [Hibiscus cannabinus]